MDVIYITSVSPGAGKTMIAAGLGRRLKKDGKRVGYIRLVGRNAESAENDTLFLKKALGLSNVSALAADTTTQENNLNQALADVEEKKDVVLVEGLSLNTSADIIQALNGRVLVVDVYPGNAEYNVPGAAESKIAGVVLNKVSANKIAAVAGGSAAAAEKTGASWLAVVPEDRQLAAVTVAELAACLGGEIIGTAEKQDELVESLMLGAMTADSGPEYFNRQQNKAVLSRSERPDMQIAAMETSTRCLVVAGGKPAPAVRLLAESKQVPVIAVRADTGSTAAALEKAYLDSRFHQEKKLARLDELLGKQVDFKALYKALGLGG